MTWLARAAVPEDESCLVALWLRSYAHSFHAIARGAGRPGSDPERRYWNEHAPVVEYLLRARNVATTVLCDPERATYTPTTPAVIYAFASTGPGDVVHAIVAKRAYLEFAAEMTRDLLGDRLERPHVCSHELPEMRGSKDRPPRCGVHFPRTWTVDEHWLARQFLPKRGVAA